MPGFDGTGPMGLGPMTGGGRGFCAIPLGAPGVAYSPAYSGFMAAPYGGAYPYSPLAPYGSWPTGFMPFGRPRMGAGRGRGGGLLRGGRGRGRW